MFDVFDVFEVSEVFGVSVFFEVSGVFDVFEVSDIFETFEVSGSSSFPSHVHECVGVCGGGSGVERVGGQRGAYTIIRGIKALRTSFKS